MQAKINVSVPLEHCEIMFGLVDTLEQKNENDPKLVAMIDLIQKIIERYMNGPQQQSPDTSISTEALYREKMNRVLSERQVQQFKRILKKVQCVGAAPPQKIQNQNAIRPDCR